MVGGTLGASQFHVERPVFQSLPRRRRGTAPPDRPRTSQTAQSGAGRRGELGSRAVQSMTAVAPPRCSACSAMSWLAPVPVHLAVKSAPAPCALTIARAPPRVTVNSLRRSQPPAPSECLAIARPRQEAARRRQESRAPARKASPCAGRSVAAGPNSPRPGRFGLGRFRTCPCSAVWRILTWKRAVCRA